MTPQNQFQVPSLELMREVCARAKTSRSTIYTLIKKGELRPIRRGGRIYFDRREVDRWLEEQIAIGRAQTRQDTERFSEMGRLSAAARRAKRAAKAIGAEVAHG